ncbi:glucan ABC transporter ATP-binding protein/ permease [Rhodomicrobium lacus]|uniref:glucan ABC transporter ATP-binding protein/ permease n=1 Tax=Rhodomicrobium lacus TaxID=2498452 RepID=UPI0026E3D239|nr:glucan ABC transporter ATP-binding protein/ permease [Rhodomicrobium lacus]WKW50200.1 glucan ABC transporter ATP-binding protein/ permease [Rhodomicrobium lacus]
MKMARIYIRALGMLASERWLSIALVAAGVAIAIVQLAEPILFGRVVDALSKGGQAFPIIGIWAALGLFNIIASVALSIMADRLAHRQRLAAMGAAFERAINLPVSYHAQHGTGRLVRIILAGTDQLFALWLSFLREHLTAIISIVLLIPVAISIDTRLAALLGALAVLYFLANTIIIKRTQGGQENVEAYHQDVFGRVGDVIGNVTVVQSYTRLLDETSALRNLMADLLRAQYPVLTWWAMLTVLTRAAATITMVAVFAIGAILAERGEVTVGEIVAFVGFAGLLIAKLDQLSSFVARIFMQAPTLQNFFDLLDTSGMTIEKTGAVPLENVKGRVTFDHATYRFPNSDQGVFALDFDAAPGQTFALVGPTGSGKTTTLALLQRLRDPQEGRILIDGTDIRDVTLNSLRQSIAVVFQDAGLFNRSIAENIRVGRPTATDAEVEEAARLAEAHDFILAKPGGYGFVIGERGSALSGGERQRIAIARAILKNAPILILDEATSALDNETELKIKRALDRVRRGRTTFLIAHRLSTVASADKILVLEKGRIVEAGTFAALAEAGGIFERLVKAGDFKEDETDAPAARAAE